MLSEFALYPAWNPFIISISGTLARRRKLAVRFQPWEGRIWRFRPRIVRLEEERELCWMGRLVLPWLLDGRHCFTLQPDGPGRTRFTQRETFRGLLLPLVPRSLLEATERGFEGMNEALKARAEREQRTRGAPEPAAS